MAKRDNDDDLATEASVDEERKPRPHVSALTLVLCLLNVVAALGFTVLLALDYSKRQAWSYAVFKHDLALMGLPLKHETSPSASRVTIPRPTQEPENIKKAFTSRGGGGSGDFQATALAWKNPILVQHMTPEIQDDWFKGKGEPVQTLEDEVERLEKVLPTAIARAAQETADGKDDADKRQKLHRLLLPLVSSVHQAQAVEKKIKEAPAAKLDDLLKDAAQRRMLVDILAPLEKYQPAPLKDRILENVVGDSAVPLEQLADLLSRRMKATIAEKYDPKLYFGEDWLDRARDSVEKRQSIAFLLFTLAQVNKPDGTPLFPDGPERVEAVVGLYEYALAGQSLTRALIPIYDRLLDAIRVDRDGSIFMDKGKLQRNAGFIDQYQTEVRRLQGLLAAIKEGQNRRDNLYEQIKGHENIVKGREAQVAEVTKKLLYARKETARQMKALAVFQGQLFQAKIRLRDAQEVNLNLERQIRHWEGLKTKGASTP